MVADDETPHDTVVYDCLLLEETTAKHLAKLCREVESQEACFASAVTTLYERDLLALHSKNSCYSDWRRCYNLLHDLGMIDLSLTRIIESHISAVRLIQEFGSDHLLSRVESLIKQNKIIGLWHHNANLPVKIEPDQDRFLLEGSKRFSSGLGLVTQSVVTGQCELGKTHLLLVDVSDFHRMNLKDWQVNAMKGSASGSYRFDGVSISSKDFIGQPEDFFKEPEHTGNLWRFCASLVGAMTFLHNQTKESVLAKKNLATDYDLQQVFDASRHYQTAKLWTEYLAQSFEERYSSSSFRHCDSLLGQATVIENCHKMISALEKVAGAKVFFVDHPAERMLRDLRFYLNQGNQRFSPRQFAKTCSELTEN